MYQVIVSNVGCVYDGGNWDIVKEIYDDYCELSKVGKGRVAGESVTLMYEGDILREYDRGINREMWYRLTD